jgi:hypothetical protein
MVNVPGRAIMGHVVYCFAERMQYTGGRSRVGMAQDFKAITTIVCAHHHQFSIDENTAFIFDAGHKPRATVPECWDYIVYPEIKAVRAHNGIHPVAC